MRQLAHIIKNLALFSLVQQVHNQQGLSEKHLIVILIVSPLAIPIIHEWIHE